MDTHEMPGSAFEDSFLAMNPVALAIMLFRDFRDDRTGAETTGGAGAGHGGILVDGTIFFFMSPACHNAIRHDRARQPAIRTSFTGVHVAKDGPQIIVSPTINLFLHKDASVATVVGPSCAPRLTAPLASVAR